MASAERQGMSVRKFRCDILDRVEPGAEVTLDRSEETHLFKILRANPGDVVDLLDGCGRIASAEIRPGRTLIIRDIRTLEPPARRVHLYIAPPRRQKMDSVLREATELGVWRIVPMVCEFSVSEPDASSVAGRWADAMFEACKQSGNVFLPQTSAPLPFAAAVADAVSRCDELRYGSPNASEAAENLAENIAWFVGPEGGFSETEEKKLLEAGAKPLRIGRWILRVETAAVAGIVKLTEF